MNKYLLAIILASLVGCSAKTSITSATPATNIQVRDKALMAPTTVEFKTTSFGQYDFKAVDEAGKEFYGLLPLKFNPGYLVTDILLFAPGLFFNLREVYPQYEMDLANGLIKYRRSTSEPWHEYKPTAEESSRAKLFFDKR